MFKDSSILNFKQFPTEEYIHTHRHTHTHTQTFFACLLACTKVKQAIKCMESVCHLFYTLIASSTLQHFPNNWIIYVGKLPQVPFEKVD